ncbi:MAG: nucleotidyltransferase family protein [Alphaproteobacteria bacterium]|nr:nucleotidyltransferase family protein [Alphaproteobacteria bacterium]
MRALLLAAGLGTRLRPLTETVPKCLVRIHDRPLLDYWLTNLFSSAEIERVLVNTHYHAGPVNEYVASTPWHDRIDLVHEPELLGTGGTIKSNLSYFGLDSFLVAHADNLTNFDIGSFIAAHEARPPYCALTMLAFRTDDPRSCGVVELDKENIVRKFHEKVAEPPGNLANAAVYVFSPEVARFIGAMPGPFIDLSTEVIPHFLGRILAVETSGYHRDIGNLESLRRAHAEFEFEYNN